MVSVPRSLLSVLTALSVIVAGCGGGQAPAPGPAPPGADLGPAVEAGPLMIVPASAAGFHAETIPSGSTTCALLALYGSEIRYLASRAMLDRIVFCSDRDGRYDIWVCDLDGSHLTQLTNNTAEDRAPVWSPDGSRIAFQRRWPGQDTEILVMNADGSDIHALTNDTTDDEDPSWSFDGRALVFASRRTGNWEIFSMFADGSTPLNLTTTVTAEDDSPDCSSNSDDPQIAFVSDRYGGNDILKMAPDGTGLTRLTNDSRPDYDPDWMPGGSALAYQSFRDGNYEVMYLSTYGGVPINLTNHPNLDVEPCWSSDRRWFAFSANRNTTWDLHLQQWDAPYTAFELTDDAAVDSRPDLGGRTMQTDRVLIGPSGSDWGGLDPIWSGAPGGICAFSSDGYRGFVRIGIAAADVATLQISPLEDTGLVLAAAVVEARRIVNLREDAGRRVAPTVWDLNPFDAGAAVLYFNAFTGKLTSVLTADDAVYPTAAGAGPGGTIRRRIEGDGLVVEGRFSAVFDAGGHNIAPGGATAVRIGADGPALVP